MVAAAPTAVLHIVTAQGERQVNLTLQDRPHDPHMPYAWVTPPDFTLEVGPGESIETWIELFDESAQQVRVSDAADLRKFGDAWEIVNVPFGTPVSPPDRPPVDQTRYWMSLGLNVEAHTLPVNKPPRRVLDTRLLSGVTEAPKYGIPSLSGGGGSLRWLDLLQTETPDVLEEIVTLYPPTGPS